MVISATLKICIFCAVSACICFAIQDPLFLFFDRLLGSRQTSAHCLWSSFFPSGPIFCETAIDVQLWQGSSCRFSFAKQQTALHSMPGPGLPGLHPENFPFNWPGSISQFVEKKSEKGRTKVHIFARRKGNGQDVIQLRRASILSSQALCV